MDSVGRVWPFGRPSLAIAFSNAFDKLNDSYRCGFGASLHTFALALHSSYTFLHPRGTHRWVRRHFVCWWLFGGLAGDSGAGRIFYWTHRTLECCAQHDLAAPLVRLWVCRILA